MISYKWHINMVIIHKTYCTVWSSIDYHRFHIYITNIELHTSFCNVIVSVLEHFCIKENQELSKTLGTPTLDSSKQERYVTYTNYGLDQSFIVDAHYFTCLNRKRKPLPKENFKVKQNKTINGTPLPNNKKPKEE